MNQHYANKSRVIPVDPTVRDLLMPLFRRKQFLGGTLFALLIITILSATYYSHVYSARMEILVNRDRLDPTVSSQATNQAISSPPAVTEEEINSEVELLQSPDILTKVALANGLAEREKRTLSAALLPKQSDDWYLSKAVDHLSKNLTIDVVKKTNMIEVAYKSSDPRLAYGILKELSGQYLEKHLAVQRPSGSYDFFARETDKYKQALADSELRLASFGSNEGTVAPDVQRTDMAQEVVNSMAALNRAREAVSADEQRIEAERAQMTATPARSVTLEVSNTAELLLQQLETNLLAAQIKRTQLTLKYSPDYPLVQEADQEIEQTEKAIANAKKNQYKNLTTDRDPTYELLREDIAKTQADLASQRGSVAALQTGIHNMQEQMVSLDQKALKQSDLVREAKADESIYLLYLSKREQERTSDALDQKRIGNVAIAVPPMLPVLPVHSPLLVLLIGTVLAVLLSIGLAFVMEYLDSSFRTPSDVTDILGIPVLASIPKQERTA